MVETTSISHCQTFARLRSLFDRRHRLPRSFWVAAGLQALLGGVLCFVPLANLLGYELSLAVGLLGAVTSLTIGLGAAREDVSGLVAVRRTLTRALLHLVAPLALVSANALRVRNCDYLEGLAFFFVLPVVGALYGAALGLVVGRLLPRQRAVRALSALVIATGHITRTLWALYTEPPIFAYDHLWGHFSGSLYDEVIRIDATMIAWRLGTLLRVVAAVLGVLALERVALRRSRWLVGALLVVLPLGYDTLAGQRLGFRATRAQIEQVLSTTIERPGLIVHLSPHTDRERALAIVAEHAFRLQDLSLRLHVQLEGPVHSYVYDSEASKRRLMGAAATVITKPWLREIHIHAPRTGDPILAHEMVHIVASAFGKGPLRISARGDLLPDLALTEGLAEALSPPRDELDLDAWAHSLRALGLAPDIRSLFGTTGFWRAAPSRAYTVAGSFVGYLLREYGTAPLERVYGDGDFARAYGTSLDRLIAQWESYVDALPTNARERRLTESRYRTPSIFVRTCAHEIASLREAAARAPASAAIPLLQRISDELGHPASAELALARALLRAGDARAFRARATTLVTSEGLTDAERTSLRSELGMLAWTADDLPSARAAFSTVLASATSLDDERLQWVRLWALAQPPPLRRVVRELLAGKLDPLAASVALTRAALIQDGDGTCAYLVARQLHRVDDCVGARSLLTRAGPHPFVPIEAERLRLLGECAYRLGDLPGAQAAYERLAEIAPLSGELARARDWLARIAWRRSGDG
ncbi:MAG: hypothetical protein AAB426_14160 [Myxococcota bacterium]